MKTNVIYLKDHKPATRVPTEQEQRDAIAMITIRRIKDEFQDAPGLLVQMGCNVALDAMKAGKPPLSAYFMAVDVIKTGIIPKDVGEKK